MSPPRRCLIACLVVSCLSCAGCEAIGEFQQKPLFPLNITWVWEREDNLFVDDRYLIRLNVFHEGQYAVAGKYVVRVYGDVFGQGGVENDEVGDNYDESPAGTYAPGDANGFRPFYYLDDPELKANNIPADQIKQFADLRLELEFIPTSAWDYRPAKFTMLIEKGEGRWVFE